MGRETGDGQFDMEVSFMEPAALHKNSFGANRSMRQRRLLAVNVSQGGQALEEDHGDVLSREGLYLALSLQTPEWRHF